MFKVIRRFKDKDGTIYEEGSHYGKPLHESRKKVLTTKQNKYNAIFLQEINYPKSTGGSWYELSNGDKVQGKQKAEKAEADLH